MRKQKWLFIAILITCAVTIIACEYVNKITYPPAPDSEQEEADSEQEEADSEQEEETVTDPPPTTTPAEPDMVDNMKDPDTESDIPEPPPE